MENFKIDNTQWQICPDCFRKEVNNRYVASQITVEEENVYITKSTQIKTVIEKVLFVFNNIMNYAPQEYELKIGFTDTSPVTLYKMSNAAEILLKISATTTEATIAYQFAHELFHFSVRNHFYENYGLAFIQEIFSCLSSLTVLQELKYYKEYEHHLNNLVKNGQDYCGNNIKYANFNKNDINNGQYGFYTFCAQELFSLTEKGILFWSTLLEMAFPMNLQINDYNLFFQNWYNNVNLDEQKEIVILIANKLDAKINS